MRKIFLGSFVVVSILCINNANAECPLTISHDDARAIANGERNPFMSIYEPVGDMKDMVVKKGLSKAYTEPRLISAVRAPRHRLVCSYTYEGKLSKKPYTFSINIPESSLVE
jgi:hypothetical protein